MDNLICLRRCSMVVVTCIGLTSSMVWGLGPERDTSFLEPGRTELTEVKQRWDESGSDFATPNRVWDAEMCLERAHVYFTGEGMAIAPPGQRPVNAEVTLELDPAETAKWTKVWVRVFEYRRYLASSGVADPVYGTRIHLVFPKAENGDLGKLLYYRVGLRRNEIDWEKIQSEYGLPDDITYQYVVYWPSLGEPKRRFVFRRYPAKGIGFVWDESMADGGRTDPEKLRCYDSVIHFVPEGK